MKNKSSYPKCEMHDCWKQATRRLGGLCTACAAWWRRIQWMTPTDLASYMQRQKRFGSRFRHLQNVRRTLPARHSKVVQMRAKRSA
jgi:hypothetical protein